MNLEQKQRAQSLLEDFKRSESLSDAILMATLLQELIAAQEQAAGLPDGWKLVPIAPTAEMIAAMEKQWMLGSNVDMAAREYLAALAAAPQAPAVRGFEMSAPTILPDGSAFATASYHLPSNHWLYAEREYEQCADDPKELPKPLLNHSYREIVVAAIRYAVRGATMCGKDEDFDPDAMVQNAVYALCGPFNAPAVQADMVSADDLAKLLPYGYYMDQPDGGSPTVLEQVARMAEDAARYRYLRNDCAGFDIAVAELDDDGHESWVHGYPPDELDAAIDAARAAQKGGES